MINSVIDEQIKSNHGENQRLKYKNLTRIKDKNKN